jgi:hypothetical protein
MRAATPDVYAAELSAYSVVDSTAKQPKTVIPSEAEGPAFPV